MHSPLEKLLDNVRQVIVGKDDVIRMTIAALLARGHVLIEDVPGLGKTMLARSLAQSLEAKFKRIQFTPDLMPSDVTGVSVYHPRDQLFEFIPGPVFTDILLADEINRTSPRTQSSLLEAMEERQVTVDGETHVLSDSFFVIATQNPIELEGTYPLPEAQLDRFLMRLSLGYPEPEEEVRILEAQVRDHPLDHLKPVLTIEELRHLQRQVREVRVSPEIQGYIVGLTVNTRKHPELRAGASPRGSVSLMRAAQAHAFLLGLDFVTPDSVKAVAPHVLAHRLVLDAHRESAGVSRGAIIERILEKTAVPTQPHGTRPAEVQG
ncbi:MAG: MoxR family ATPase [Planctomycetota bacterium]|nr:MoxR family ATPase [Planctomycetota bacterium]